MNKLITIVFLLSFVVALSHTAGIKVLPKSAAKHLKTCAWRSGWYAANTRIGYKGYAKKDKKKINSETKIFKNEMKGILTSKTINKIRDMFKYQGWNTANTRWGYKGDAKKDKKKVSNLYKDIKRSKELSSSLAKNIRAMGWKAAWHGANTRVGYRSDAKKDKKGFKKFYKKIYGKVQLVSMTFKTDDMVVLQEKPRVIFHKNYPNCGSIQQQSPVSTISETVQHTTTYSHSVGFEYTVSGEVSVSLIEDILGYSYSMSFTMSSSQEFSQSMSHTVHKEETFSIMVPPYSTYIGESTVHEVQVDVPYEMVFDFGGVQKTEYGAWNGVLMSQSVTHTYPAPVNRCSSG